MTLQFPGGPVDASGFRADSAPTRTTLSCDCDLDRECPGCLASRLADVETIRAELGLGGSGRTVMTLCRVTRFAERLGTTRMARRAELRLAEMAPALADVARARRFELQYAGLAGTREARRVACLEAAVKS